jgi:hypothetical protein
MRYVLTLAALLCALALAVTLCGCNKVTGGGGLTCIGPWDQVGLYLDTYQDEAFDWGFGIGGGVEYDRCTFGFTGQFDDDPATPWTYEAKGQLQFVDHTKGVVVHTKLTESWDPGTDPKSAEYEAQWESWVPGAKPPGTVTLADGSVYPIDYIYVVGSVEHWALFDRSVPLDPSTYPTWPYLPMIDEGYGDVLRVSVDFDDYGQSFEWVGVVENGNITVH